MVNAKLHDDQRRLPTAREASGATAIANRITAKRVDDPETAKVAACASAKILL